MEKHRTSIRPPAQQGEDPVRLSMVFYQAKNLLQENHGRLAAKKYLRIRGGAFLGAAMSGIAPLQPKTAKFVREGDLPMVSCVLRKEEAVMTSKIRTKEDADEAKKVVLEWMVNNQNIIGELPMPSPCPASSKNSDPELLENIKVEVLLQEMAEEEIALASGQLPGGYQHIEPYENLDCDSADQSQSVESELIGDSGMAKPGVGNPDARSIKPRRGPKDGAYRCPVKGTCNLRRATARGMLRHFAKSHDAYCPICDCGQILKWNDIHQHFLDEHEDMASPFRYQCSDCDVSTWDVNDYMAHRLSKSCAEKGARQPIAKNLCLKWVGTKEGEERLQKWRLKKIEKYKRQRKGAKTKRKAKESLSPKAKNRKMDTAST